MTHQKVTNVGSNFFKSLFAIFVFGIYFALLQCGRLPDAQGKQKYDTQKDTLPSLENFNRWESKWSKDSWIVGTTQATDKIKKTFLQKEFGDALTQSSLKFLQRSLSNQSLVQFESLLRTNLNLELVSPKFLQKPAQTPLNPVDFLIVTFPEFQFEDQTFVSQIPLLPSIFKSLDKLNQLQKKVLWQWHSIAPVQKSLFFEPNLYSQLFDTRTEESGDFALPKELDNQAPIAKHMRRIKADLAYQYAKETLNVEPSPVTVAVLDTGVDYEHPDLKEQMFVNPSEPLDGQDNDGNGFFDDIHGIDATLPQNTRNKGVEPIPGAADLGGPGKRCPAPVKGDDLSQACGHGSHVAGIIAARHGANLLSMGVCPTCRILSLRVADRCLHPAAPEFKGDCKLPMTPLAEGEYEYDGGISDASQVRALSYISQLSSPKNPDDLLTNVVNMSLGKYFRSRSMSYLIQNLLNHNVIVAAAAGNDNTDTPSYPAAYSSVISVCALGTASHRGEYGKAVFSNFGDWVDICAPGVDIGSTMPGGLISDSPENKSGTSQATPFVAGVIGYMLSVSKGAKSSTQIISELKNSANSAILYNAPTNKDLYRICYSGDKICDHLLGAGIVDMEAAIKRPVPTNSIIGNQAPRGVKAGCVVSKIGDRTTPFWLWSTSVPFALLQFWLIVKLFKRIFKLESKI